jgi:hypothetical protein
MNGTPTTKANADWPLFSLHLKRTLIPLLIGSLGVYFAAAAGVFFYRVSAKAFRETLDVAAIVLIILVAAPVGTAPFSRAFKEQYIVFLHAMPIARARQWLLLVASSLTALLTLVAAFLVIRPSLARLMVRDTSWIGVAGMAALLFAAGTCFGIIVRHPVAVYAGAFVALLLSFNAAMFVDAAPRIAYNIGAPFRLAIVSSMPESAYSFVSPLTLSIVALLFLVAFLTISLVAYVRGEVALWRMQLRNVLLVAAVLALIAVAGVLTINAVMIRRAPWEPGTSTFSPSGNYLLHGKHRKDFDWKGRASVTDTTRGMLLSEMPTDGVVYASWVGEKIVLLRHDMPTARRLFTLRPQRDSIEIYTPQGALVSRYVRSGVIHSVARRNDLGRLRVAYLDDANGTVVDVDSSGRVREIASAPADIVGVSDSIAYFQASGGKSRVFRIDGPAPRELPWYHAAVEHEFPVTFRDLVYPDLNTFLTVMKRDFPLTHAADETVAYALNAVQHEAMDAMYAIVPHKNGLGTLYALPPRAKDWSLVCDDFVLPVRPVRNENFWDMTGGPGAAFGTSNRFAACVNGSTIRFYDAARGAALDVEKVTTPPVFGIDNDLLFVSAVDESHQVRTRQVFRYDGSRMLPVDIKTLQRDVGASYIGRGVTQVYRREGGRMRVVWTFRDE